MWCYNCFGGGLGSVENDRMPQSKRRIKRGMKSSTSFTNIAGDKYSGAPVYAEISAAGEARIVSENGGSQTLLGIVSVSHSGLIPVILSPVAKPSRLDADIISVSSMTIQKTADAESASVDEIAMKISDQEIIDKEDRRVPVKRGRRSWVRIIKKKTSGFLTQSLHRITQNGKVQQDPNRSQALSAHGSIDTGQPKPFEPATVEQENNLSPSHPGSSPAPNIHHSFHPSPARGMDRTNKNFKLRPSPAVQSHPSAPTSPRANEIEPSASSTSILHTQLPAHQPNRFHQPSSLESNRGRLHSRGQFPQPGTKTAAGYDTVLSVTGLVIILGCLVFSDRLCAIVCTSMWWYLLPRLRNASKLQGYQSGVPADSEDIKGTAPSRSAIKGNKLDLQSSEYRKKVIMEGLLQRNHKFV